MNKRLFFSLVISTVILPSALALGQAQPQGGNGSAGSNDTDCSQMTSPDLISNRVNDMIPWLDELIQNQSSNRRLSDTALINDAFSTGPLKGGFGTTAYESFQSIEQYIRILDLRILIVASQNGVIVDAGKKATLDANVKLLHDTHDSISRVVDAFNKFIDQEQHRPKAKDADKMNDKDRKKLEVDKADYDKKLDAKAADVKKAVFAAFNLSSGNASLKTTMATITHLESLFN